MTTQAELSAAVRRMMPKLLPGQRWENSEGCSFTFGRIDQHCLTKRTLVVFLFVNPAKSFTLYDDREIGHMYDTLACDAYRLVAGQGAPWSMPATTENQPRAEERTA